MKIKKIVLWVMCLLIMVMISSCSTKKLGASSETIVPEVVEYPVIINDTTITQQPKRVIVMSASLAEIIADMGYETVIIGTSDGCEYPTSIQKKPKLGSVQLPKLNDMATLNADLILSTAPFVEEDLIKIQQLNVPTIVLSKPKDMQDLSGFYATIAKILVGQTSGITKATQFYQTQMEKLERITSITGAYAIGTQKKTAVYVHELDSILATGDTFIGKVLVRLSLENLAQEFIEYNIPKEKYESLNPEIIFYNNSLNEEAIIKSKIYKNPNQKKSKSVFSVNEKALGSYSIRMFDELEKMARSAYGDAFASGNLIPDVSTSSTNELKETSSTKPV